jgi:RecA/RadA recombinase
MNDEIAKLIALGEQNVKKMTGREFLDIKKYDKTYGIPGYIPFNLPDLDLLCGSDEPMLNWGIARGRVTELSGPEASFKSTLCHQLAAEVLDQGGLVYWFSSETDFSERYARKHLREYSLDFDAVQENYKVIPVMTVQELFTTMQSLMKPWSEKALEIEEEGGIALKEFPPILFILDSLSAMMGGGDYERIDDKKVGFDGGPQVGGHAHELHRFFKYFLVPWMRIGATFVYTNHVRANLGFGYAKTKIAHDMVVRHYCNLRIALKSYNWNIGTSKANRGKMAFQYGKKVSVQVMKERNDVWVLDGETELTYQYNYGWDIYRSVINMLCDTGVAQLAKSADTKMDSQKFIIEEEDPVLCELNGTYTKIKDLKEVLNADPARIPEYVARAMKRGPLKLEDLRETK